MVRPRKFTPEFKAKVALAALKADKPLAALCREHRLSDTVVIPWRPQLLEYAAQIFAGRMDLYTRAIRGWHLGRTLSEELTYTALEQALARHDPPAIHHSDHGIQYPARGYLDKLQEQPTRIGLSSIGRPTENGFCERLMPKLKEEEVYLQDYADEVEARRRIGHFLKEV